MCVRRSTPGFRRLQVIEDDVEVSYAGSGPAGELHRWFVHHDEDELLRLVTSVGFSVTSCDHRTSHRTWAMILATA
jgi:hypothetical protein